MTKVMRHRSCIDSPSQFQDVLLPTISNLNFLSSFVMGFKYCVIWLIGQKPIVIYGFYNLFPSLNLLKFALDFIRENIVLSIISFHLQTIYA